MSRYFSIVAAVLLVTSTLAWGIAPVAVENPSFELPGLGDFAGWDGEYPDTVDVPGWTSDSDVLASGVQSDMGATDGDWVGLLLSGDPSVWQVTEQIIVPGEAFRLKVDGAELGGEAVLQMSLFAYDESVDPNDPNVVTVVRMPIGVQEVALTPEMQTYTLDCNVADAPELVGHKLGIEMKNLDSDVLNLAIIDNIKLFAIVPTGVNVIWVTEATDQNYDGLQDDQDWIDWLKDEGHTVDVRPNYWASFTAGDDDGMPKIDQLDAADLVIISRTTNSGAYSQPGEPELWNSVKTPIMLLNGYLARSTRWNWVDTDSTVDDIASVLELKTPDHAVLDGVTVEQLNLVDPNTLIDPNDPNAPIVLPDPIYGAEAYDSSEVTFVGNSDTGNGTLIAQTDGTGLGAIAEWKSGLEYYDGADQMSGDHRMLFCAGTPNGSTAAQGAWNLTADGETMFRNAIAYLLAQPLPAREFEPVSGTTGVALGGPLSWRAGKLATTYAVYLSTDENAVAEAIALVAVTNGTSLDLTPLKLELGKTYYWRVDATDGLQTWPGPVLSFTTIDYLVVDDFESYTGNITGTWKDWWTHDGVDRGASIVPDVNETIVLSGNQSMALSFDNSTNPFYFDAYRKWSGANWTTGGARYLVINLYGDPNNHPNDNLWVKINGVRVNYNGDGLRKAEWTQWAINISALPTPQWKIEKLDICVGDPPVPAGAKGIFYVDDIRLYRVAP